MPEGNPHTNRRRLMQTIAAASAAGVAGCGSDGGGGGTTQSTGATTTTDDGTPGMTESDGTLTETPTATPIPEVDGAKLKISHQDQNPGETDMYNFTWWTMPDVMGVTGAWWSSHDFDLQFDPAMSWRNVLNDEVTINDDKTEITVKFRDDAQWSNGDEVKGEDLKRYAMFVAMMWWGQSPDEMEIEEMRDALMTYEAPEGGVWYEDAIIPDGKEVTFVSAPGHFDSKFPPKAAMAIMAKMPIMPAEPSIYDEHINEYIEIVESHDSAYSGEGKNKLEELRDKVYSTPDSKNYAIGPTEHPVLGPFEIVDFNETKYFLERMDGHPLAKEDGPVNWSEVEAVYMDSQTERQSFVNGNLSASGVSIPSHALSSLPDNVQTYSYPNPSGNALQMHGQHPVYGEPLVRQAIMHAINREQAARIIDGQSVPRADPIDIPGLQSRTHKILDDSTVNQFITYERSQEKVNTKLKKAGLEKKGGTWKTPDGKDFKITLQTADEVPQFLITIASQLKEMGLSVDTFTTDSSTLNDKIVNGNYEIIETGWSGERAQINNFWFWAVHSGVTRQRRGFFSEKEAERIVKRSDTLDFSGPEARDVQNVSPETTKPFTVEAPPVGQPDGPMQEYNPVANGIKIKYNYAFEDDKARQNAIKRLSWVYNWYLPELPVTTNGGRKFHNNEKWLVPPEDNTKVWSQWIQALYRRGYVSADPSAW